MEQRFRRFDGRVFGLGIVAALGLPLSAAGMLGPATAEKAMLLILLGLVSLACVALLGVLASWPESGFGELVVNDDGLSVRPLLGARRNAWSVAWPEVERIEPAAHAAGYPLVLVLRDGRRARVRLQRFGDRASIVATLEGLRAQAASPALSAAGVDTPLAAAVVEPAAQSGFSSLVRHALALAAMLIALALMVARGSLLGWSVRSESLWPFVAVGVLGGVPVWQWGAPVRAGGIVRSPSLRRCCWAARCSTRRWSPTGCTPACSRAARASLWCNSRQILARGRCGRCAMRHARASRCRGMRSTAPRRSRAHATVCACSTATPAP